MPNDNDDFDLVSIGDLKQRAEFSPESQSPIYLDPDRVPPVLHHLISLAEKWGNPDDTIRDTLIESASDDELLSLKAQVRAGSALLNDWLGGEEADSENPTLEYVVFSAMRMAADEVPAVLVRRERETKK